MTIRKFILLAVAAICLGACTTGNQVKINENNTALDTASVVQRVKDIYADVFHHYELMALPDGPRNRLTGIKPSAVKFCTQDWNYWVTQVTSYDVTHNEGEIGFFDADYWIMGQDWGDLSVSDIQVTEMTDSTATAELNLHNLGTVTALRLDLCLEDGIWRIDNFIDVKNDIDWKANMKDYLSDKSTN